MAISEIQEPYGTIPHTDFRSTIGWLLESGVSNCNLHAESSTLTNGLQLTQCIMMIFARGCCNGPMPEADTVSSRQVCNKAVSEII